MGNNFVTVKRNEQNVIGVLNNLHKANGVDAPWALLADTLAGGYFAVVNRRYSVDTA